MFLIFQIGIRRGVTQVVKRYAKASSKYMKDEVMLMGQAHIFNIWTQTAFVDGQ